MNLCTKAAFEAQRPDPTRGAKCRRNVREKAQQSRESTDGHTHKAPQHITSHASHPSASTKLPELLKAKKFSIIPAMKSERRNWNPRK